MSNRSGKFDEATHQRLKSIAAHGVPKRAIDRGRHAWRCGLGAGVFEALAPLGVVQRQQAQATSA